MCWPSQPQSSPPSRRITVALRSTPSVPVTASMISARQSTSRRANRERLTVCASSSSQRAQRVGAARQRIRPLRRVIVLPGRRLAGIFRLAGLRAIEPVDRAERIVPGDREANAARVSPGATRMRRASVPCSGCWNMLRGRARLLVAPLAQAAGPREFAPVEAEAVEPLPAQMIVDVLDAVALGRDREIAALRRRPVDVGGGEVQRAEAARSAKRRARRCRSRNFRASRRSCSRSRASVSFSTSKANSAAGIEESRSLCGMNGLNAVIRTLPGKRVAMELDSATGKRPMNVDVVEMRNAGHRVAIGAEAESVELAAARRARRHALIRAVENARVEQLAVPLGLDREMAVAVELMDGGPVADAPIDQPPASRQRDAAGADAAERKGDVLRARSPR